MRARFFLNISFIFLWIAVIYFINPSFSYASSTDTTIYFSSIEKNLESGEIKVYYSAGNAGVLRTIKNGISTVSYIHPDYLGSTILTTDNNKNLVLRIKYYPYGEKTTDERIKTNDKLYTGQIKDVSSDLYFYNARYYNPNTTHFISADKAEGPNRYSYVSNNPIMKNDPSGNREEEGAGVEPRPWTSFDVHLEDRFMEGRLFVAGGVYLWEQDFGHLYKTIELPLLTKFIFSDSYNKMPAFYKNSSIMSAIMSYDLKNDERAGSTYMLSDMANPIFVAPLVFEYTSSQQSNLITHEMSHSFSVLKTDYLKKFSKNGPNAIENIPDMLPEEGVSILDTASYLVSSFIRSEESGRLYAASQKSIPESAYALKNWEEFFADSFADFQCSSCFKDYSGYNFPFKNKEFFELVKFYEYLKKL